MAYQVGDWVKVEGLRSVRWVYGRVQSIREDRILVDRGYLAPAWYPASELSPAIEAQSPQEIAEIRDAIHSLIEREKGVDNP